MYKITHYDQNCCPIADGTISVFVESLEEYEKYRFKGERDEGFKERYFRSKNGEIVTDYYSDDPELNIVIGDKNSCVVSQKQYVFEDRIFELVNFYDWPSEIYVKKAVIDLYYIRFKDKYYLTGKYFLEGVCRPGTFSGEGLFERVGVYGNPVLIVKCVPKKYDIDPETGLLDVYFPKEAFAEDTVTTFCHIILNEYSPDEFKNEFPEELDDGMIQRLMADIPGEAG